MTQRAVSITAVGTKQDPVEVFALAPGRSQKIYSSQTEHQAWELASHLATCLFCRSIDVGFFLRTTHLVVWHGDDYVGCIRLEDSSSLSFEDYLDYVRAQARKVNSSETA